MRRLAVFFALFLIALAASGPPVAAQTLGMIEGRVTDATGAVLPGATVTVTNTRTSITRVAVSNAQGLYRALNLNPGEYEIKVELASFRTEVRRSVTLAVGETLAIDFHLELQSVSEAVEVTAFAPLVNTVNPEIGQTVDTRKVTELPLNGRDFTRLSLLAPGAVQTSGGFATLTFNGTGAAQNNFMLDGVDATRIDNFFPSNGWERGSRLQTASVESIQEFRVLTTNYSAEYGRAAGAIVNAVTKSGGNAFHGSAYGFFRNDKFDARNFFDPDKKPKFDMKQFGGSLGGPVRKDRVFFFGNYEGGRKELGAAASGTVPSASFRARIAPELAPILASVPLPTESTSNPDVGIIRFSEVTDVREDIGSARVDFKISDKDTVFARWNIQDSLVNGPLFVVRPLALSGQRQYAPIRTQSLTTSWVRVIRPNVMNEFKFGINRFRSLVDERDSASPNPIPWTTITGVNVQPGVYGPFEDNNTSFEYIDTLSWFRGAHSMKTGATFRRIWVNLYNTGMLQMTFPSLAEFAANRPNLVTYTPEVPMTYIRGYSVGAFFQDDIKVSRNFTLNAGVRYDYTAPWSDLDERLVNFDTDAMMLMSPGTQLYDADVNNIAPRLGIAWDITGGGRSVIRGGYGMYYNAFAAQSAYQLLFGNILGSMNLNRTTNPDLKYPLPAIQGGIVSPPAHQAIPMNRQDNYNHQWNVNLQQQLGSSMAVQIGYVGNRSLNNDRTFPLNLIDPATGRRPDARYSQIMLRTNTGTANYHSLQIQLNRRLSKGFAFNLNYAYSHLRDNIASPQDPSNWDAEWATGGNEVPHNFSANAIWELPFGPGRRFLKGGGVAGAILGGWQLNLMTFARSGLPINVQLGTSMAGQGWFTNQRPDIVAGQDIQGEPNGPLNWLNPDAFARPAAGKYGNLERNAARGPKFVQVDMSLFKNVQLPAGHGIQLRVEVFNLLNEPIWSQPSATWLSTASFGRVFNTFGRTEGFGTSRQIQFGARYTF